MNGNMSKLSRNELSIMKCPSAVPSKCQFVCTVKNVRDISNERRLRMHFVPISLYLAVSKQCLRLFIPNNINGQCYQLLARSQGLSFVGSLHDPYAPIQRMYFAPLAANIRCQFKA